MANFIQKYLWSLFAFFSMGLLVFSVWSVLNTRSFLKTAVFTEGEVIDVIFDEESSKPVIQFKTHDDFEVEFVSSISSDPPRQDVGDVVPVYYQPGDPIDAKLGTFFDLWFFSLITGFVAFSFALSAFFMWFMMSKGSRYKKWAMANGQIAYVRLTDVRQNKKVHVNRKNPYYLVAEWQSPVDGKTYEFRSEYLWEDPSESVQVGQQLQVWVDINNPKKHYIDLSFLKSKKRP